jgi:ADP-dependent NAD(P)H-hydrate dehydratase / NAD(P)H-hydrate epimerase
MRQAHTVDVVRASEGALMARLPEGALMQRAAAGVAAVSAQLIGRVYGSRVVLLVGSGDNGGDALFAGARLARRGAAVDALLLSPDRAHPAGLAALRSAGGTVIDRAHAAFERADLVMDGIVGIGGRGGLRSTAAEIAQALQAARTTVVAVDVPSGVDASTGQADGTAIQAHVTVTFGTYKPGLLVDPGASYAGVVELVDIGLGGFLDAPDAQSLQATDVARMLPMPTGESDKYRRGVLGVLAGSDAYPGAAVLSVGGALHSGAGMVRFVSTPRVVDLVRSRWPEVVAAVGSAGDTGRVQAWTVGPGIGTDESGERRLDDVLDSDAPALVDADGLTILAKRGKLDRAAPVVLTPHAGEAARLLAPEWSAADVEARRIEAARRCAERYGATVLLKGSTTVVAGDGGGPVLVNPTGTPWLATAGSGDVLSGLGGALLAASLEPRDAAGAAAFLHGLAARLALAERVGPITAADLVTWLPAAWSAVSGRIDDV